MQFLDRPIKALEAAIPARAETEIECELSGLEHVLRRLGEQIQILHDQLERGGVLMPEDPAKNDVGEDGPSSPLGVRIRCSADQARNNVAFLEALRSRLAV